MPNSDENRVYSVLNEVLDHWRSGAADDIDATDVRRLDRLINSDSLVALWRRVGTHSLAADSEHAAKLLLSELFSAAQPVPPWDAQTGTERKTRLSQIVKAADRLSTLISDSPLRYFSEDAIEEMRLAIPPLGDGPGIRRVAKPDFDVALADLREQADTLLKYAPILRRPSHEDAHRRYFVLRTAKYLRRRFDIRSGEVIAELAAIMLNDESIDTEVVRKMLASEAAG